MDLPKAIEFLGYTTGPEKLFGGYTHGTHTTKEEDIYLGHSLEKGFVGVKSVSSFACFMVSCRHQQIGHQD